MPRITRRNKLRGGFFSRRQASPTKRHTINMSACPNKDVKCDIFDTQLDGKVNPSWMTCINKRGVKYHIKYVTPANMLIKSIESVQIPHFNVAGLTTAQQQQQGAIECKLKIENKFIGCFALICGEWYAIMRLLGKTINTGVLAMTVRNRAYYRLNTKYIQIDEATSAIKFAPDAIKQSDESYILSTKKTPILNLDAKVWEHVDREHNVEVFRVLNTFRIQKLVANVMKYQALGEIASIGNV